MSTAAESALWEALERLGEQSSGYKSWGEVHLLEAAIRLDAKTYLSAALDGAPENRSTRTLPIRSGRNDLFSLLFRKRRAAHVLLVTRQSNASQVGEDIPPILDDQAQLLGPTLRYVQKPDKPAKVLRALSGRYAANLSDGRTICIGSNIDEAYIAAQLVEKTSKAWLGAKAIGGAKSINRFEAWAMHKFYMWKYSKESERNR